MRPPICAVCRRRLDLDGAAGPGGSGLVRFADYRPLPDGMTGHPQGLEWFCRRHHRAAGALRDLPLAEALARLRRRRWRRVAGLAGLVLVALVTGAWAWSTADPGLASLSSLYLLAGAFVGLAAVAGRLRRVGLPQALADGRAAAAGTSLALATSLGLFAVAQPHGAAAAWGVAGSAALLASPLGAALALRARGRRSMPRALLASAPALAGVIAWLTLNLRGPRGGWTLGELAAVLPAVIVAVASAACLGWWSKRAAVPHSSAGEAG